MKKNGKEEKNIEPIKLSKKEIRELKKQFPITKQELEKLEQNKKERLKNKLEILVMVFWSSMLLVVLYLLYLTLTYQTIGW